MNVILIDFSVCGGGGVGGGDGGNVGVGGEGGESACVRACKSMQYY